MLNWFPIWLRSILGNFSICVSIELMLLSVKFVFCQCCFFFVSISDLFLHRLAFGSWAFSPGSVWEPEVAAVGAERAWTLMSWAWGWIQPLPLAHCANMSKSYGCHLPSTICVCDSRPTSHQAVITTTLSCHRQTHRKWRHVKFSWVWDLVLNPEVSDGFLGQGVWQREAFSRVRARWVVHTGSEWLWAPNPSFEKNSIAICLMLTNLLRKSVEATKVPEKIAFLLHYAFLNYVNFWRLLICYKLRIIIV